MRANELELKITVDKKALDRLRNRALPKQFARSAPTQHNLRSTYFDTPDLRLNQAKIAFRVRQVGDDWVQTVKRDVEGRHGLMNRRETETFISGPEPDIEKIGDEELQRDIVKLISGHPLSPVFETVVARTTQNIDMADAGMIELAVDDGEIRAGDKRAKISEIELEHKTGSTHALLSIAEALFSGERIETGTLSKAARGFALLKDGDLIEVASPKPQLGEKPELDETMSGAEGLATVGRAAADQILSNWQAVLATSHPEGPHQLRVGLRRLRTAIKVFKGAITHPHLSLISRQARDLARVVGDLRDADVLLSDIYVPALSQLSDENNGQLMHDLLVEHADRRIEIVRSSLESGKWSQLQLNCILFEQAVERAVGSAKAKVSDDRIAAAARKSLRKCWRQVKDWGQRIEELSSAERHEMRKSLKTLRYATEFFASLFGADTVSPYLHTLKNLQDVFGYLNDVSLARHLSSLAEKSHPKRAELLICAQEISDWHNERADEAWHDAKARWRELADAKKFWKSGS